MTLQILKRVDIQALRYLVAGIGAFTTEYVVFVLLFHFAGLPLYGANSLSFLSGLAVSFSLNRTWTFREGSYHYTKRQQFMLYACLALINLVLTNVLIGTLKHLHVAPLIGKLVAMCMIIVWNFLIFRAVIFKNTTQQ